MFTFKLIDPWAAWVAALAAPLHGRLAWRLTTIVLGILLANGRRTFTRWWIAAGISKRFRSYYYSIDSIGRKAQPLAAALLKIVQEAIPSDGPLVFAIDDTPTQRYGPKVQGAGIHHNPSPGPAGSNFLYGRCLVTLSRVADQANQDVPGDLATGRRGGAGGDPEGSAEVVASVPLQRPGGECRGDRAGGL